ncbi:MAG: hypothetical protein KatS3mg104_0546 [Phycisphaerae bacterium]|nr:MAG: hypothetical protein KatS3mg104_0546 [Phycisphaerae bacterium]
MHPATSLNRLEQMALSQERRQTPRQTFEDLAIVTLGESLDTPASQAYAVQLMDLSIRGARFVGKLAITPGQTCVLHTPVQNRRVALIATVIHVSRLAGDKSMVGIEFRSVVRPQEPVPGVDGTTDAELARIRAAMLGN